MMTSFTTGTRPELYLSFGIHMGTLTQVQPGLNLGCRPCLRAGFQPGFSTRLRHTRIVSVWRNGGKRRTWTERETRLFLHMAWNNGKLNKCKHTHANTRVLYVYKCTKWHNTLGHSCIWLSCHTCWVLIQALTPLFRALQLLRPLTDKQGSPPLQHYCWSHLLYTPHTEGQLWIWNGTSGGCVIPFPLQHNGSWDLLWPSRLRTTSDFLSMYTQYADCVDIVKMKDNSYFPQRYVL